MNNSGIYKIICMVDKKIYLGSAKNLNKRWKRHLNDLKNKKHVNTHLQRSFDKYGIENFRFEIIEVCKLENLFDREQFYLDVLKPYKNGFNIGLKACGGDNLSNNPNRENIISKIKKSIKEKISKMSDIEKKKKWSNPGRLNPNFGNKWTKEQKIIASEKQKSNTKNTLRLLENSGKSNMEIYGEEKAIQISKKLSEHASSRTGEKNPFFNKKHSKESKEMISKKRKGIKPINMRKISIEKVIYESYTDASRALNLPIVTIRWRCLSSNPKFEFYKLI